jgi:outer membrane protein OmpA-like peptidoglycan-associated protein
MDKQAAELQNDLKDARVERVGEGIKITFNSGILFDVDSSTLRPAAKTNLSELSKTLQKYADTNVMVQGYTDSTGSDAHNLQLSELRANSVSHELKANGVVGGRIDTEGLGEASPVESNDTEAGRQANRRVEVAIMANEKLKKAAQQGRQL